MPDSVRFVLGDEWAAGFDVWDAVKMRHFYYNAKTEEEAAIYVGGRNLIDAIFTAKEQDRENAKQEFYAWLEGDRND